MNTATPDPMISIQPFEPRPDDHEPVTRLDYRIFRAILLEQRNEIVRRLNRQDDNLERLSLAVRALSVIVQLSPKDRSQSFATAIEQLTAAIEDVGSSARRTADAIEKGGDQMTETNTDGFDSIAVGALFDRLTDRAKLSYLERIGLKPEDLN